MNVYHSISEKDQYYLLLPDEEDSKRPALRIIGIDPLYVFVSNFTWSDREFDITGSEKLTPEQTLEFLVSIREPLMDRLKDIGILEV